MDVDGEGECGEEVIKRSWHLQCYQSPVELLGVKNGACCCPKEDRPYMGPLKE